MGRSGAEAPLPCTRAAARGRRSQRPSHFTAKGPSAQGCSRWGLKTSVSRRREAEGKKRVWPELCERTGLEKGSRETSRPAKDPFAPLVGRQHPSVLVKSTQHPIIQPKSPEQHGEGGGVRNKNTPHMHVSNLAQETRKKQSRNTECVCVCV